MGWNLVLLAALIAYVSSESVVRKEVGISPDGKHYVVQWEIIKQHNGLTHDDQDLTPNELEKGYGNHIMSDYLQQHPKNVHDILRHRQILNEMGNHLGHQMGQGEEDTDSLGGMNAHSQIFPGQYVAGHLYGSHIHDYSLGGEEDTENSYIQDTSYPTYGHSYKHQSGQQHSGERIVQIQGVPYLVKGTVGQSLGQHGYGSGQAGNLHLQQHLAGHLYGHQIGQHDMVNIQGNLYPIQYVQHQIGQCDTNGCHHVVEIQGRQYPVKYVSGHSVDQHELSDDSLESQGHLHSIHLNQYGQQDADDINNVGLLTGHQIGQQDVAVHVVEIQGQLYPIKHVGHLSGLHDTLGSYHFVEVQGKLHPVRYVLGHSIHDSDAFGTQSHQYPTTQWSGHLLGQQDVDVDAVNIQGRLYPIKHLSHLPGTEEHLHFIESQGQLYPVKYTHGHSLYQHGLDLGDSQGHFQSPNYVKVLGSLYPVTHLHGIHQQFDTDTANAHSGYQPMRHIIGHLAGQYNEGTHEDEETHTDPILVRVLGPHGGFQLGHYGLGEGMHHGGYIQH